MLQRLYRRRITRMEADIMLLDKRLADMVAADAALAQRYELLISMPGVGPVLGLHARRPVAGTRTDEPQAGRGSGRRCTL